MSERSTKPAQAQDAELVSEEELVPHDDAIIGKAFRLSLVFLVIIAAAIGGVFLLLREAPVKVEPREIPFTAPVRVQREVEELPLVRFVDVTDTAGIDFAHENGATGEKLLPETMGGGCAFFDYDNDGDQDLLLVNSTHWIGDEAADDPPTMALYRNDGVGWFENVTTGSGLDVSFYGTGAAVGDYDNDGDVDVFISAVGSNHLFRNEDGYFQDVTAAAGVAGAPDAWSTSTGFFDYDNDGDLDLFVCNYVKWSREIDFAVNYQLTGIGRAYGPPTNFEGAQSYLYRNDGDGTFADVSEQAGIHVTNEATHVPVGKALGLAFSDVDHDGWIDIFVANDTVRRFLFRNRGDGTFEEVGQSAGVAFDRNGNATGAMGTDVAHFRNDPAIGFVIGNFANEMSSLLVSQAEAMQFADESIVEGLGAPTRMRLTFGAFYFDYDLDGRLDLLHANGHLEEEINVVQSSQHYEQPAQLFWNTGKGPCFVEVPGAQTGDLAHPIVGRGAAYADIDSDGDHDVLLTQTGGRPMLLRNEQALGHDWLRVKLRGTRANRDAIGAWIELTADSVMQRRQVMPTRSYLSQVELPVTFGLGPAAQIESLRIMWPDGAVQEIDPAEIELNREIIVEQEA